MIRIIISLQDQEQIKEILITGHAGYAEAGQDIVCAAVSSQAISVENSIYQLLNIPMDTQVNESQGGYLRLTLPEINHKQSFEQAQLLLNHLRLSLEILAENYPEYIEINYQTYKP